MHIISKPTGIRSELIASYDVPRLFFSGVPKLSPVKRSSELGALMWYSAQCRRMGHTKRILMDTDALVERWAKVIIGLATAHDKDEADRYEAAIEQCLTPILSAPIKQVRDFYPKLLTRLKNDPSIPFLVWRGYEIWIEQILSKAPDEDIKQLKTDLAREITELVEQDVKDQIPEQLMRALQWRRPEVLEKVKTEVVRAKERNEPVRLVGRESCLFMEVGGEDGDPAVCVQI